MKEFLVLITTILFISSDILSASASLILRKNLPILSFDEGYNHLFGDSNLVTNQKDDDDGKTVQLQLNKRTGSGFVSQDLYLHGFFSASIKLPADYTAGVVVAFYMSNGDMFERNHDELDFEFLGNIRGKDWKIQTNVYGNGSTAVGREERYGLWFDPSQDFHHYSILWTQSHIIFYVDDIAIREVPRSEGMGGVFPSKPMSLYATIWDGSTWATNGGKYKVNYKYAPFVAEFSDLVLHGCTVDPIELSSINCDTTTSNIDILSSSDNKHTTLSSEQRVEMMNFRTKHMTYSYCYDHTRYLSPPAECVLDSREAKRLGQFDPVTFGNGPPSRKGKRRHRRNRRTDSMVTM
ncbi:hypothetical protein C5167_027073 [Papaver somniferum]|uniref:probable xyloglucan endotransglucosylase/hydrolase protein 28 n=1 Tax=Papaver somniferum TaxID=3469 RepID=UPI000E703D48|nr:probable xyloglucan endotransglucosylase/hydrolase protein 28 [Papaver somniferum]RZC89531.1 hypothetical protein C5167_027073 [Papaver somniferum]